MPFFQRFWATACKTVRPMLSDMSVCPACLSVTLVYCGQTVGWIKMPLGMEIGLSPEDFVLDGDPAPPPQKGRRPQIFGSCLLWPNGCMDRDGILDMDVGLSPGDFVFDGDPAPFH